MLDYWLLNISDLGVRHVGGTFNFVLGVHSMKKVENPCIKGFKRATEQEKNFGITAQIIELYHLTWTKAKRRSI